MASAMKFVKLANGASMPMMGLGTWKSKAGDVETAVKAAIDAGYRHIDCAFIYGNEAEVGSGIKAALAEGKVKREDLFIVSKLWNTFHRPEDVLPAVKMSLERLQLDYLDLYLIHWPMSFQAGGELFPRDADGKVIYASPPVHPTDTWKAMEGCLDAGLVKNIGVSNFNSEQIQDILDKGRVKPATNQVEIHPYFGNDKLVKFCHKNGISVTAYSPFASPDRPWASPSEPTLLDDPKLKAVADKYKKTPAQTVLRWLMQRDIIVIPKSVTPSRIQQNLNVFDFELSAEDMDVISSFETGIRIVVPYIEVDGKRVYRDRAAPNFPFNIEF